MVLSPDNSGSEVRHLTCLSEIISPQRHELIEKQEHKLEHTGKSSHWTVYSSGMNAGLHMHKRTLGLAGSVFLRERCGRPELLRKLRWSVFGKLTASFQSVLRLTRGFTRAV